MTTVCWRGDKFWLGKPREHPKIMSRGRTIMDLEKNLRDACRLMTAQIFSAQHN